VTVPSTLVVAGAIASSVGTSHAPMKIASTVPTLLTIAISSSTRRATDHRVAPIARRSASSPPRDVTCASVRLAMLHEAMSSKTRTAQKSTFSGARKLPYCHPRKVRMPPVQP